MGKKQTNKSKKDPLKGYVDTTGTLSNTGLRRAEWFVRHRELLRHILIGVLSVWCVFSVGFSLWQWGDYFVFGYAEDRGMILDQVRGAPNYQATRMRQAPVELQVFRPEVFGAADGKHDFVVDVVNPNERWVAELTYTYTYSGGETESEQTTVMPGSRRPVVVFGHEARSVPRQVQFVLSDVSWTRISAHDITDPLAYVSERLVFHTEDFTFTPARGEDTAAAHSVAFDVYNDSAYNYWSPTFYVELLSGFTGEQRAGVLFLSMNEFRAGDVQEIDVRSFAKELNVAAVRLHPVIDVFDESEFMEPGA